MNALQCEVDLAVNCLLSGTGPVWDWCFFTEARYDALFALSGLQDPVPTTLLKCEWCEWTSPYPYFRKVLQHQITCTHFPVNCFLTDSEQQTRSFLPTNRCNLLVNQPAALVSHPLKTAAIPSAATQSATTQNGPASETSFTANAANATADFGNFRLTDEICHTLRSIWGQEEGPIIPLDPNNLPPLLPAADLAGARLAAQLVESFPDRRQALNLLRTFLPSRPVPNMPGLAIPNVPGRAMPSGGVPSVLPFQSDCRIQGPPLLTRLEAWGYRLRSNLATCQVKCVACGECGTGPLDVSISELLAFPDHVEEHHAIAYERSCGLKFLSFFLCPPPPTPTSEPNLPESTLERKLAESTATMAKLAESKLAESKLGESTATVVRLEAVFGGKALRTARP